MIGKIKLIVAIEDEIYLDRICDYLETSHGRFVTERFSSREALHKSLSCGAQFDALLFEPEMLSPESRQSVTQIKILLGEKDIFLAENDCYTIREYQKTEAIANAVLTICSKDKRFMGIDVISGDRAKLYVFTSPVGGCGTTTVSLATAMQLAASGRKTLYISLEQIPSLPALLPSGCIGMTQIMRMVIENSPKLLTAVEGEKGVDPASGLEYFCGFGDITDFDSLEPEHLRSLAEKLCTLGRYDTIIADVCWNIRLGTALFENAKRIFLVSRNTNDSCARINSFLQYAAEKERSYRNRLSLVVNALSGGINSGFPLAPAAVIPKHPMIIDTSDFPSVALRSAGFSDSFAKLLGWL